MVAEVVGGQEKSAGTGFNVIRTAGKRGALRGAEMFPVEGNQRTVVPVVVFSSEYVVFRF